MDVFNRAIVLVGKSKLVIFVTIILNAQTDAVIITFVAHRAILLAHPVTSAKVDAATIRSVRDSICVFTKVCQEICAPVISFAKQTCA